MFLYHLILAGLCASTQCAPLHDHGNDLLRSLNLPIDEVGATAFSLLYGAPLQQFRQLASTSGILKGEGSNALGSHYTTATASVRNVVRPNVDTIYATGIFDLSATDVVVTLPPMEDDRFYLFGFYDPYGDLFATLGSVDASTPGRYLLGAREACCDDYAGCITSPNPIGTLLIRVEVKNNDTDVTHVASYLSNSTLATVNPHAASHPPLTLTDFADLSNSTVLSTLQLTARLQSRATPESAAFQHKVPAILALAGIRNGSYNQPNGVNMTLAAELAKAATTAFTKAPSSHPDLGNGWSMMNNSYSGTFESGTAIVPRAITAAALYLQVTPANALYPTLGSTQTSLSEGEAYVFTFSGRPPVADNGFWSLTMYDDGGYLVANAENTWAVGDRSNITFADGGLVYGNGTADGSFQVLVQDAGVPPPTNWTSNWLPAPSGGGSFTVTFRLYAPTDALSNGSYVYPLVEKVDAITA
ncbi:hypothetical protein LTR56_006633 [Elasticomyces elasticus]|nr:hypothetical protein LTR22_012798 [Elasticomyces elasticus]KAK3649734.1 hypothetical protein LTR56_006633 [Elasticomyces elasticus]KAK5757432.1 hypothetical protein LTS12_012515 [Elasticomyces elasticus]